MVPEERPETVQRAVTATPGPVSGGMGILFFSFGLAAGVLVAYSAAGFLEDSAGLILAVFLSALLVLLILGVLVFALRKTLLRKLFGHAEVALEEIANPLTRIADRAIAGDPGGATAAARDLVAMVLARYAWITTRRWIIASLTALIAAMAALAGTALLFKQNQLIAVQSDLLREQNTRIQEQTALLQVDVELAEAARNSDLSVEITQIAAELGKVVDRVNGKTNITAINVLDPLVDLDRSLVLRIASVSTALYPYRSLDTGLRDEDMTDGMRVALQARREVLGDSYQKLVEHFGWVEAQAGTRLIDRPASPERGQLLSVLISGGVRDLEFLIAAGLNLDYAVFQAKTLILVSAQQGRFAYADFSGSYFVECDFGLAILDNARFRLAKITRTRFAAPGPGQLRPPLNVEFSEPATRMPGADFQRATITESDFSGVTLTAASFDGALLNKVSFASADISVSTFRDTVLLSADFSGAFVKRTDFDGAIVFGEDYLTRLAETVAPETFRPELFRLEPVDPSELQHLMVVTTALTPEELAAASGGAPPFRITRIGDF